MGSFNTKRSALRTDESHEITRSPLRTIETPWVRSGLRSLGEVTKSQQIGSLAARGLGWLFNTQGHKLRSAAQNRAYRDQMRQHLSDDPEALKHLEPHFGQQARDDALRATHGRFARMGIGADAVNPMHPSNAGSSQAPATTSTSHTPPAPSAQQPTARLVSPPPASKPTPYDNPTPGETPAQAKQRMKDWFAYKRFGTAHPPQPQKQTPAPPGFSNTAQQPAAKKPVGAASGEFSDNADDAMKKAGQKKPQPATTKPAPAAKPQTPAARPVAKPAPSTKPVVRSAPPQRSFSLAALVGKGLQPAPTKTPAANASASPKDEPVAALPPANYKSPGEKAQKKPGPMQGKVVTKTMTPAANATAKPVNPIRGGVVQKTLNPSSTGATKGGPKGRVITRIGVPGNKGRGFRDAKKVFKK